MTTLLRSFPFLVFLLALSGLHAQITPAEAVAAMGRGINLGNTLEPPTEGAWNNGPAEEKYFDAYVEAGFTNVRVPVRWDEHTMKVAPYTIDAGWLDRVEEVMDWGLDRGLYITINTHHDDWIKQNYEDPAQRARFDAIWRQIAERFRDKSELLLFEMINEPFGMTVPQVDDLNQRVLEVIRESNPTRLVIYGGNQYANSAELLGAKVLDDPYTIGYFHSYDPFQFGLEGRGTWGTPSDLQQLEQKFAGVAAWSTANDVPVYLSEFGAVLQADYNSRMRFYAAFTEAALRYGFAFSTWDDGGMFRILDRTDGTWPVVKDVLINTYSDSPTELTATTDDPVDTTDIKVMVNWVNRAQEGEITLERATGEGEFSTVATLPAGTTSYADSDSDIAVGNFYVYRVSFTRASGTLVQSYPVRVLLAGEQTPYGDEPIAITDTLQAEDFDRGGEGVAYHDSEAENIPNAYRPDEGVDIEGYGNGAFAVGYLARGEWLEYTVNVPEAGAFAVTASLASAVGNGMMKVSASDGSSALNFTVPAGGTDGYNIFEEVSAPGVLSLSAGEQIIRIDITGDQAFNIDYLVFSATEPDSGSVVNYADRLDTAAGRFTGEPAGITFVVADGELTIAGDGTSPSYQTIIYNLPDSVVANVAGSGNKLYIGARTLSGNSARLRIDIGDENNYQSTLAGRSVSVSGTEFKDYLFDYTDGYQDGAYGGTGCTDGPCAVNGSRIVKLILYPEPDGGKFGETIVIDYLSFGNPLTDAVDTEAGVINYADDLADAADAFEGNDAGLLYSVFDGVLSIIGDGTAAEYRSFRYNIGGENGKADAIGSNNKLLILARTKSGASSNLRIDLVDENDLHTSLAGLSQDIAGSDYKVYTYDFSGGYQDGGYGGTGCEADVAPCTVDGQRIKQLVFYPDAATGKFNDTIDIDWISFGVELSTAVRDFAQLDGLTLFPNPVQDQLNLRFQLNATTDVQVDLYDALGRNVRQRVYGRQSTGATLLPLDVSKLPGGTYFLQVRLNGERTKATAVQIR